MGSTIEDVLEEINFEEELKRERKEAFGALEKIAGSNNIQELQNNLDGLRNIYVSDIAIDDGNIEKLISELDLSLPKLKECFEKSKKNQKIYFYIGLVIGILGIIIVFVK